MPSGKSKLITSFVLASALLQLAACNKDNGGGTPPPPPPVVQPPNNFNNWNGRNNLPFTPGAQILNVSFDNGYLAPNPIMGTPIHNKELRVSNFREGRDYPAGNFQLGNQQIKAARPNELTCLYSGGRQTAEFADMSFLFDNNGLLNFSANINGEPFRATRIPYQYDTSSGEIIIADFIAQSQLASGQHFGNALKIHAPNTANKVSIEWPHGHAPGILGRIADFSGGGFPNNPPQNVTTPFDLPASFGITIVDRMIVEYLWSPIQYNFTYTTTTNPPSAPVAPAPTAMPINPRTLRPGVNGTRVIADPINLVPVR